MVLLWSLHSQKHYCTTLGENESETWARGRLRYIMRWHAVARPTARHAAPTCHGVNWYCDRRLAARWAQATQYNWVTVTPCRECHGAKRELFTRLSYLHCSHKLGLGESLIGTYSVCLSICPSVCTFLTLACCLQTAGLCCLLVPSF